MKFQEAIDKRHSVRSFKPRKVSKIILKSLIKDATKAPSSSNNQNWKFYVVSETNTRNELAKILSKSLKKSKDNFNKLSPKLQKVANEFYSDLGSCQNIVFAYIPKGLKFRDSAIASISCACQNLMLSATNKDLGTCWVGTFKGFEKEINKLLKIPKDEELVASILVGYPSKDFKPLKRTKKKISDVLTLI